MDPNGGPHMPQHPGLPSLPDPALPVYQPAQFSGAGQFEANHLCQSITQVETAAEIQAPQGPDSRVVTVSWQEVVLPTPSPLLGSCNRTGEAGAGVDRALHAGLPHAGMLVQRFMAEVSFVF